jgi:hypothetical protein
VVEGKKSGIRVHWNSSFAVNSTERDTRNASEDDLKKLQTDPLY